MPNLRVQNLGASLKILFVDNTDLTRSKRFTYLTDDVVNAGTSIRVQSLIGFENPSTSSGQIICIGEIGSERTEIVRTSQSAYPSNSYKDITLRDAMIFDHPADTKIYIIDWSRAEFQYAGTATGTKSTLSAYPLNVQADLKETQYRETAKDSVFYFVRFNDTIESRNSDFSDPVFTGGYDDNSVFMIKKRAMDSIGEEIDGNIITHEFLNQALWEGRREYHNLPGKRPFRRKFNTDIGNVSTGMYRVDLPTDVERPYTAENVYGVRIGVNQNLRYYDKKEWDFDFRDKPHSTLDVPYTRGTSTSIWLTNGRDFSGSPTISVEGMNISCTRITGSQNSFTITAHGAYPSASIGSDAWENVSYGLPDKFTVWADPQGSAYIYFNRPVDTAYVDQNIYADYYRTLVPTESDADILDEPYYDLYVNYLAARIKQRKNKGLNDMTQDPDFKMWQLKKSEAFAKEYIGTDIRFNPDVFPFKSDGYSIRP